jgi:heavy metal sensor kinase
MAQTLALFDEADTNAFYFAIWSHHGDLRRVSTNAPAALSAPEKTPGDTRPRIRARAGYREAYHFTERDDCILVGRVVIADLQAIYQYAWLLIGAGGAVLLLGLAGGWALVSRSLRPLRNISATASAISAGNLSERINAAETDSELGQLASVLNSTFARLEAAFAQQKQFTADASHELRTPLAVLISEAQTALARERTPAEYRETVEACLETAQRMRRLTESLLQLSRLDSGQQIERAPIDLAEAARLCSERLQAFAEENKVQIRLELAPVRILSNAERVNQVLTNLLANSIQYNKPNGSVSITSRAENGDALLVVSDTGIGIASEDLPHIFERFYRADKSRARANGHGGLGLAICKAIVETDGGSIEVSSQAGAGTTVTVRWCGENPND